MDFISLWLVYQLNFVLPTSEWGIQISEDEQQHVFKINLSKQQQEPSLKFDLESPPKQQANTTQLFSVETSNSNSFWSNVLETLKQGFFKIIETIQSWWRQLQGSPSPQSNETALEPSQPTASQKQAERISQQLSSQFDQLRSPTNAQKEVTQISQQLSSELRYIGIEEISNLTRLSSQEINDFAPIENQPVISPDVKALRLASVEKMEKQSQHDHFQPQVGTDFHEDGSLTMRVLVGNDWERLTVIGDFNNWGEVDNLDPYQLTPLPEKSHIHTVTLPPDDYHKKQYRLVDQNGNQRLHLGATLFSTPGFNERFYDNRESNELNSVFWKPSPIPESEQASWLDLRGKQLSIAETDVLSLSLKWQCQNPDSQFYRDTGEEHIPRLYNFVRECGLPEAMAQLGYNTVEFMPLDSHVDSWEPGADYLPDWRYSYQTISVYGKHPDFGSPDELRAMINAFHQEDVAVLLDVVYSHYSPHGNKPPRKFGPLGFGQYTAQDGSDLYGSDWTEWATRRFKYTPEIRQNLVDAALVNILDYGFDGLRIDNVNGIDAQPNGRTFLRELTQAVDEYRPQAVVIGEGYFGDPYLNRVRDIGGAGLLTTYSDRFYLWFTENLLKHVDEIDTWKLDHMLSEDWPLAMLYYPGNHDEFANPGNPFQARGRYLVDAIDGGYHNQKIRSWSALTLFTSSYYLDMFQLWTMQEGNLNSNTAIDWSRLREEQVAQMVQFQGDMKRFFRSQPAFAPYNMHRNMLHWIDHDNKVVVFERIDFETGQRVYAVTNLGDHVIEDYTIPVHPKDAKFEIALDSDRAIYGGKGRNPRFTQAQDHELEFSLGAYGVVGFVQADGYQPEPTGEIPPEEPMERPRSDEYNFFKNYRP